MGCFPMTNFVSSRLRLVTILSLLAYSIALLLPDSACAQLITFTKQDLVEYTPKNPFARLSDGIPEVPDEFM